MTTTTHPDTARPDPELRAEVLAAFERYGDTYRLANKLRELDPAAPAGSPRPVWRAVWSAARDGDVDLAAHTQVWWVLPTDPTAYDADDVLGFLRALIARADLPEYQLPRAGWTQGIPGWNDSLERLVRPRAGDPAFLAALAQGAGALPEPFRSALGFALARRGVAAVALPDGYTHKLATLYVLRGSQGQHQEQFEGVEAAVGREAWRAARLAAAVGAGAVLPAPEIVDELLALTRDPRESLAIATNTPCWHTPRTVTTLEKHLPGDARPVLEEAFRGLDGKVGPAIGGNNAYPPVVFAAAFLRSLHATGQELPADLDRVLAQVLEHLDTSLLGQHGCDALLLDGLRCVPLARLERLLLDGPRTPWALLPACPTAAVTDRLVAAVAAWGSVIPAGEAPAALSVATLGALAAPRIAQALAGKALPQRLHLLNALSAAVAPLDPVHGPAVAKALADHLGDATKSVRESARATLLALAREAPAVALAALEAPLLARKKDARQEAAGLLAELPPSPERAALAARALAKETLEPLRDLLASLATTTGDPGTADGAADGAPGEHAAAKAALDKVLADHGAQEYLTAPFPVIDWAAPAADPAWSLEHLGRWFAERTQDGARYWSAYETMAPAALVLWRGLLGALRDHPAALAAAARPLGWLQYRGPEVYLASMGEVFTGAARERFGAEVGSLLRRKGCKERAAGYAWLAANAPRAGREALIEGLADSAQATREVCAEGLRAGSTVAELAALLAHPRVAARQAVAGLLGAEGSAEATRALQAALTTEKVDGVKAVLVAALAGCGAGQLVGEVRALTDADLDARLAALQSRALPIDATKAAALPAVRWRAAAKALSAGARAWLLGALGGLADGDETRQDALLAEVRPRLVDEDCHALCAALLPLAPDAFGGWGLFARAVVGSDEHLDELGAKLEELASSQRYRWGSDGVEALVRRASDGAVRWLDHWARSSRRNALLGRAREGLERLAKTRGVTVDDMVDGAMPRFGFGPDRRRAFPYGSRTLTLALGGDNDVALLDEAGKTLKSLPAPHKDDAPAAVAKAKAELATIRKEVKRIHKMQPARLELALGAGRCWEMANFRARLLEHPVMRPFARALVFQLPGALGGCFRVTDDGGAVGVGGEAVQLPAAGGVRLAHPAELGPAATRAWRDVLDALKIRQPFDQIERTSFERGADPAGALEAARKAMHDPAPGDYLRRSAALGYERGPREDAGVIVSDRKTLGGYEVHLQHTGYSPEALDALGPVEVRGLTVTRDGNAVSPADLPPRIYSEVRRDLARIGA